MNTFAGAVMSFYLATGVPVQNHTEAALETTAVTTGISEVSPAVNEASLSVQMLASNTMIEVKKTIEFSASFSNASSTEKQVYGLLRSPMNTEGVVMQERWVKFSYHDEKKLWIAQYTPTEYDPNGEWTLELLSFDDKENTIQALSFTIVNPAPIQDNEKPHVQTYAFFNHNEKWDGQASLLPQDTLALRIQADDSASDVRQVTAKLEKLQSEDVIDNIESNIGTSIELQYDMATNEWIGLFEWKAMPLGEYKATIEAEDYAGNIAIQQVENTFIIKGSQEDSSLVEENNDSEGSVEQQLEEKPATEGNTEASSAELITQREAAVATVEQSPVVEQEVQVATKTETTSVSSLETKEETVLAAEVINQDTEQEVEQKPIQQSKSSTLLFYTAGVFLLMSVLRSNKEWSE